MTIEIPCKVGDRLFIVSTLDARLYVEENYCYGVQYYNDINGSRFTIYVEHETEDWGKELAVYPDKDIGTRIFFSEKEAEEELERRLKESMYARFERGDTVRDLHLKDYFSVV